MKEMRSSTKPYSTNVYILYIAEVTIDPNSQSSISSSGSVELAISGPGSPLAMYNDRIIERLSAVTA